MKRYTATLNPTDEYIQALEEALSVNELHQFKQLMQVYAILLEEYHNLRAKVWASHKVTQKLPIEELLKGRKQMEGIDAKLTSLAKVLELFNISDWAYMIEVNIEEN